MEQQTIVFVLLTLCASFVHSQTHPHSCSDIYKNMILRASGVYTIYNRNNQPYQVYCEFHKGYGYTYISPATTVNVNIDDLYTNDTYVIIRDLRTDGTQRIANISQIQKYKTLPMSFQFNAHVGYNAPVNDKLKPYVYIGLLPTAGIYHTGDTQGYNVNGHDVTFVNCDGNPNSYFVFEFNLAPQSSYNSNSLLIHQWVNQSIVVPSSQNIPTSFFTSFEAHFGGCGGYGSNRQFPELKGAAVGFRYDITCPAPLDIANGLKVSTGHKYGDTVTYTCDLCFTKQYGDTTQTCTATGRWDGLTPHCGQFPCASNPCLNNGICYEVNAHSYDCECQEGFEGVNCEKASQE